MCEACTHLVPSILMILSSAAFSRLKYMHERISSFAAPRLWNALPVTVKNASTLKTYLFKIAYPLFYLSHRVFVSHNCNYRFILCNCDFISYVILFSNNNYFLLSLPFTHCSRCMKTLQICSVNEPRLN